MVDFNLEQRDATPTTLLIAFKGGRKAKNEFKKKALVSEWHLYSQIFRFRSEGVYLHVKIWVDVLLFHELFDLFTTFNQLPDFFGQDPHFQTGVWNLWNFIWIIFLLPRKPKFKQSNISLLTWPLLNSCLHLGQGIHL